MISRFILLPVEIKVGYHSTVKELSNMCGFGIKRQTDFKNQTAAKVTLCTYSS